METGVQYDAGFRRSPVRIGRNHLNDLTLDEGFVSQWHGIVRFDEGGTRFLEVGSTNGTTLDGTQLETNTETDVTEDADLAIGPLRLTLLRMPLKADQILSRRASAFRLGRTSDAGAAPSSLGTVRLSDENLATLDVPDRGDAIVDGLSVLEYPRRVRMQIGYMSDQFHPYSNLDVLQYLDFFARAYGLSGRRRTHTVQSVASFCGLLGFVQRPATALSKGMGQRLHLAKTLLHDPQLLILDEPASGLDPRARIEFRALLKELAAAGKGILISSHILTELGEMCDSVVVIEKGVLEQAGTIDAMRQAVKLDHPVQLRVTERVEQAHKFLLTQPYVGEVAVDDHVVRFDFGGDDAALAALLHKLVAADLPVVEFVRLEADLEDIFLRTTRGALQ